MSKIINTQLPEFKITVEVTGGGVANARLVGEGNNDFGITNSDAAYYAFKGEKPFKKSYKFYSIAYLYPSSLHTIVMGNSPIKSYRDFKGKRIAIGPAGGGTINTFRFMMPFYGFQESDFKFSFLSFSDGVSALKDGNADVNMVIAGAPAGAAKELAETASVRFISTEEDILKKLSEKYPFYVRSELPKTMFNTPQEIVTVGLGNLWVVRDKMPEDVVYKMTKAVYENLEELGKSHPQGKDIVLKQATSVSIPLHPGAIRYYKEKGLLK
jgi:TRAP transporter TAXI family solute receptor